MREEADERLPKRVILFVSLWILDSNFSRFLHPPPEYSDRPAYAGVLVRCLHRGLHQFRVLPHQCAQGDDAESDRWPLRQHVDRSPAGLQRAGPQAAQCLQGRKYELYQGIFQLGHREQCLRAAKKGFLLIGAPDRSRMSAVDNATIKKTPKVYFRWESRLWCKYVGTPSSMIFEHLKKKTKKKVLLVRLR